MHQFLETKLIPCRLHDSKSYCEACENDLGYHVTFSWTKMGGYQVTTRGDARFSAFNAKLDDGRTIEQHYQCDVKGYDPGGTNWRLGKGKPPLRDFNQDDLWIAYLMLWVSWADRNKELLRELYITVATRYNGVLGDQFATSKINQAHALANIFNSIDLWRSP